MPKKWASIVVSLETGEKMKLIVKNNAGETVSVELNAIDTFKDLKEKVERKIGLSLDLKDIAIKGKKITESQLVTDYFGCYLPTMEPPQSKIFCVVPGCKNTKERNPDKVFFEFPSEEIRCHQWVLYCQRLAVGSRKKRLHITPESTICSDHFRPDQFVKNTNTLLKRTAVPCMKFFIDELKEPNQYSEGYGFTHTNYVSLLTEPSSNCLKNHQVRLCRLCASTSDEFYLIFDDFGKEMKIAEKINLCLPLSVQITDELPKQICKTCFKELNDLFEMADQCSISQHNIITISQSNSYNCSSFPILLETHGVFEDEKNYFETVCPLCDDGKLSNCPSDNFNNMNKSGNSNGFPYETRGNFVCHDLYLLDEYNHLINSSDIHKFEGNDTSFALSSELQTRMEVSTLCEPILTHRDPLKIEEKSPIHETEDIMNSFSQLVSPLGIEEINDSSLKQSFLPESDPLNTENSNKMGYEQLEKGLIFICRICAKEFSKSSELLRHSYDHSCKNFYQCCACVIFFSSNYDLEQHLQQHLLLEDIVAFCNYCHECFNSSLLLESHLCFKENKCTICYTNLRADFQSCEHLKFSGNTRCNICYKILGDDIKLQKHMLYTHSSSSRSHCCEECGKVFKSEASMKYHQRTHQNNDGAKPYCCSRCGKCFMRKSMLINHMSSTHTNIVAETSCITCKFCNETFPNTDVAVTHMDNIHKVESMENTNYSFEMQTVKRVFICEFCERCFVEDSVLNKHREKHPSEKPYECKLCCNTFISEEELGNHKHSHRNDIKTTEYSVDFTLPKTYLCEYCERCFLNQIKYSEHLSIHFGPDPYKCKHCPLIKFQTLHEAVEHRERHDMLPETEEFDSFRPYDCHYCSKTFAIEDALIKHIRMHTGEKPFICDQCGKGFSQSSGLYTHQKVHSTERPYSCSVCPRTFKIKGDRDVHVRKHSGDRPYKCEYCGKAFMTQHVYSQHKKIHTGERPYKCDVCGIAFRRSHVLTVHKRIHTGEKPNICHICGKSYRQKGDMLKHCRVQHGIFNTKKVVAML
ncbi:zinc finger protein 595 [Halyomorpha halys]|uniref:zinc finger protein 595 n=1 Tax=Halyomorpha halys TaxID=286706 RepID=UPI0006D4F068|nr:zinc finger protein 420 [Halyomorpha halys]